MKRTRRVNVIYQAAAIPSHLEPMDAAEGDGGGGKMGIKSTWMFNAETELAQSSH